jgi:hypothetical protein
VSTPGSFAARHVTLNGEDKVPPLQWESAGTDEPLDQNATSAVVHGWWAIGPNGRAFSVELIEVDDQVCEVEGGGIVLANQPTEKAAKSAAQQYEDAHGRTRAARLLRRMTGVLYRGGRVL